MLGTKIKRYFGAFLLSLGTIPFITILLFPISNFWIDFGIGLIAFSGGWWCIGEAIGLLK